MTPAADTPQEDRRTEAIELVKSFGPQSNLIMGRFLEQSLELEFAERIRKVLYAKSTPTSATLDAIAGLATPTRSGAGLHSIITFNYDDLIEKALKKNAAIKFQSIHDEGQRVNNSNLGIYHVHGYVPEQRLTEVKSNITLSEQAYHELYGDPFHWSNRTQMHAYSNLTCLFVGVSLRDPNIRRLLDESNKRNRSGPIRHVCLMLDDNFGPTAQKQRHIRESDAAKLGVAMHWYNSHEEDLPRIISEIFS